MNRTLFILAGLLLLAGCSKRERTGQTGVPERIISLAPDITETVYELELGDNLVGATSYCLFPEAAQSVPRVGGFGQFNFEAIVSLKPDLVILHEGFENEKSRLDSLGIPYLETETHHIEDITRSIRVIGDACGAQTRASDILGVVEGYLRPLPAKDASKTKAEAPRILMTFGGDASNLDQVHAFGSDCLHHELLVLAGGINVVENNLPFSVLSKEAIIRLNPDIIIQLAPGTEAPDDPSKPWKELSSLEAVKNNRIYVLTGDYTCIPGPRFIWILKDFEKIIRP